MREDEKKICDDILGYGKILSDKEFECDGKFVRQYVIEIGGETYDLTKHNGEWVYIHHNIVSNNTKGE